jgi:diguanylate cyclase (GGDEF)-like protein
METMVSWGDDANLKGQAFAPEDCCALRSGRTYSYTHDLQGLACRHISGEVPEVYVCLPLVALGDTLGILHLNCTDASVLSSARLKPLQQVVEQAGMTLANLNLRAKLQEQSIRDPLTGLFNRRYLEITLEREVRRSARKQSGVGIIMADGDKFKQFNDTFGHDAGDVVLKEIAGVLRRSVRSEDVVCRYGGEEFMIVLTDCTVSTIMDRAELMRNSISKLHLEHAGRSLGKVTASFGASFCQDGSIPPDKLVRMADEALYKAKKEGRDRIVLSDSCQPPQVVQPEDSLAPTASVLTN